MVVYVEAFRDVLPAYPTQTALPLKESVDLSSANPIAQAVPLVPSTCPPHRIRVPQFCSVREARLANVGPPIRPALPETELLNG